MTLPKSRLLSYSFLAFLTAALTLFSPCHNAWACNEQQTRVYVTQILFGEGASSRASDEQVGMLLDALFLCCMQKEGDGRERLAELKKQKVSQVPSLRKIDLEEKWVLPCCHQGWEMEGEKEQGKKRRARWSLLRNTVRRVFHIGLAEGLTGDIDEKGEAFCALLYDIHLLSDYLADKPWDCEGYVDGSYVPPYRGEPARELGGKSVFTKEEKETKESYIRYEGLDSLGRAGQVFAHIGPGTLEAVGERKSMVGIKPSGWNENKYEGIVASHPPYIYNRCHLLAHQLGGAEEEKNLITGTRYLNIEGMKPLEDEVKSYIQRTKEEVLYRATPIYRGGEKVAQGVHLEACSLEGEGESLSLNVYCYNVQPGIAIEYGTGENSLADFFYGEENLLPFARRSPDKEAPDFLWELTSHLESLFRDQKTSYKYMSLMSDLRNICAESRALAGEDPRAAYKGLKRQQYALANSLGSFVPLLLLEEDFFRRAF